jgi:hypothetical protein
VCAGINDYSFKEGRFCIVTKKLHICDILSIIFDFNEKLCVDFKRKKHFDSVRRSRVKAKIFSDLIRRLIRKRFQFLEYFRLLDKALKKSVLSKKEKCPKSVIIVTNIISNENTFFSKCFIYL